jgi:RNA polymerase sigma-70 factor (ECF subfamily)
MAAAYAAYHRRLLARARRIVVDPGLAEEAVQEAFTRAWRACGSFDPSGGPMVHWLLTITANIAKDLVKARLRRPPLAPATAESPAISGLGEIDGVVLRAQLRTALSRISEPHRTAVIETILRDRPYADVASEYGIKTATLRTRVHYALHRLRTDLCAAELAS